MNTLMMICYYFKIKLLGLENGDGLKGGWLLVAGGWWLVAGCWLMG